MVDMDKVRYLAQIFHPARLIYKYYNNAGDVLGFKIQLIIVMML